MKKIIISVIVFSLMMVAGCSRNSDDVIGEEKAKTTALSDAGLSENEVTFVRANLDFEDGRKVYDVEFYTKDFAEYDYEIDAQNGKILSVDKDAEYYKSTSQKVLSDAQFGISSAASADSPAIGEARAKELALERVPGSSESDIREFRFEIDDGREVYEGKVIFDKKEYEFEIDAQSGEFLSWEVESR